MIADVEDPMGWGIQVTAHYGEEIVNGQLTGKLYAPVGMTGYVPDLRMRACLGLPSPQRLHFRSPQSGACEC